MALLGFALCGAAAKPPMEVAEDRVYDPGLNFPTDLCVEGPGKIWIADGLNRRLVVLDGARGTWRSVACDSFARPLGVDVFKGRVYVADPGRPSIHVLNSSGRWMREIALPSICDPVDVLALDDQLIVSDNDNHRLLVMTVDGHLTKIIGKGAADLPTGIPVRTAKLGEGRIGNLISEFTYPGLLARTEKGFMVVDVLGARIEVFTRSGRFDRLVGGFATDGTGLFRPKGSCKYVAGDGALITDGYTGMVTVYDDHGEFVGRLTREGKVWRVEGPTAIDQDGLHVWVLDARGSRVHRIQVR